MLPMWRGHESLDGSLPGVPRTTAQKQNSEGRDPLPWRRRNPRRHWPARLVEMTATTLRRHQEIRAKIQLPCDCFGGFLRQARGRG